MKVELLHYTPIEVAIQAIRVCYKSQDKGDNLGEKDIKLLKQIVNNGHTSTLEHLVYTFSIQGISRGCLQELVRHRIVSYSVQSTRYTLHKMYQGKNEELCRYLVSSGDEQVDKLAYLQLVSLLEMLKDSSVSNDKLKYAIPEALKTNLVMTINARSLQNFFNLRLSKKAHFEINKLAKSILEQIPEQHRVLYEVYYNM